MLQKPTYFQFLEDTYHLPITFRLISYAPKDT